jgi:hypothetical protein
MGYKMIDNKIVKLLKKGYVIEFYERKSFLIKNQRKIYEIGKNELNGLIENRYLQKFRGECITIDTQDNAYFKCPNEFCKICNSNVRIMSCDMDHFIVMDYKWRCDNSDCINNKFPENTYDDERPDWVELVE